MRIKNSIKNVKNNLFFFALTSVLAFYSRKVFISSLGDQIAGINSVLQSLLGFLNILELGISNAIIYSLYKPIRESNHSRVNELIALYKSLYRIVAGVILIIGFVLSIFIGHFIKDAVNINQVRLYFLIYLVNTIASYALTYKFILANADEKVYLVTRITGIYKTIKTFAQIFVLIMYKSYIGWLTLEIAFNVFSYIVCNRRIQKEYSWLDPKSDKNLKILFKDNIKVINDTKNLFIHKISYFAVFQTSNLVLAAFCTLKDVTFYANYMMIIMLVTTFAAQIFTGLIASIGKLVSEKNNDKSFAVWSEIFTLEFFMGIIIMFCMSRLINSFIEIWLGKEYVLSNLTVWLILLNMFINLTRGTIDSFKTAYGIFWDTGAPLFETALNLGLSIFLARKIGLNGVIIGTIVSNMSIVFFWRPYILFREGFKKSILEYVKIYLNLTIIGVASFVVSAFVMNRLDSIIVINSFISFFIKSLVSLILITVAAGLPLLLNKNFKSVIYRIKASI